MNHEQLGTTTGKVLAELEQIADFSSDPITVASGCGSELQPLVNRKAGERIVTILQDAGYESVTEFLAIVETQTTSKWVWDSGLTYLDELVGEEGDA